MIPTSPANPDSIRYKSWTARGNKVAYFTGEQWSELEAAAVAAGFTTSKKVKGTTTEIPNVVGYVMHLHHTSKGATSK